MMNEPNGLGFFVPRLYRRGGADTERIVYQQPLRRVLDFLCCSIDDVINDPLVRGQVFGYYKLSRQIERTCEVVDLERWWNGKRLVG